MDNTSTISIDANTIINLISILITVFTTYRVTKYSVQKPNRLAIKQKQLDNAYLPLYLIFKDSPETISKLAAISYFKRMQSILSKNYILIYPELHDMHKCFGERLRNNQDYAPLFAAIKYQINIDYHLLKNDLGYPSTSKRDVFKHMTWKQKFARFPEEFDWLWICLSFLLPILFKDLLGGWLSVFLSIVLSFITVFVIRKLRILTKKLKY